MPGRILISNFDMTDYKEYIDIKVNTLSKNIIRFNVYGSLELANEIRKALFNVPSLAVDKVIIFKNTSPLTDEEIVYRLMLLEIPQDCNDVYYLNVTTENERENITARHLNINNDTIITRLNRNQELQLQFTITKGYGYDHYKFSPIVICTFKEITKNTYEFYIETTASILPDVLLKETLRYILE